MNEDAEVKAWDNLRDELVKTFRYKPGKSQIPCENPDAPWVKRNDNPEYKYREDAALKELQEYINSTYGQHYVGKKSVQTMDLLISNGLSDGYCQANIIKYASRIFRKGQARKDVLKILHYAILLLGTSDNLGDS